MIRGRVLRRIAYARRNRCSVLVVCLFILLNPLLAGSAVGATVLVASLFAILILAAWALRARRPFVWGLAALAFLTVDALVVDRLGETWIRPLVLAAITVFIGTITIALLRYVLDRSAITTDKVFGAVAAYILIAFSFASLFGLLQLFEPHAFTAAATNGLDGRLNWPDLMYFSFIVLTSTGFGEITPATPMARALIVLE